MDFIKSAITPSASKNDPTTNSGKVDNAPNKEGSGGIGGKLNSMLGGGPQSEKNEDMLDKGVDAFQEHVLGQGPQNNESAFEQAKDEQISDGKPFPNHLAF